MWIMVCRWPQSGRWLGETPFVQVSMMWALTCPETVHQRPCVMREIETWLSDSMVGNSSVIDHRSRLPVLSSLRTVSTDLMPDHIGRQDASRGCSKTSAYTGQFGWASVIGHVLSVAALQHREGGATLLSTGSHESCVGCRQHEIRCIELWSNVNEICVAGSCPHWTAICCNWVMNMDSRQRSTVVYSH